MGGCVRARVLKNSRVIEVAGSLVDLREVTRQDFDAVRAYASDPEVYRFVPFGPFGDDAIRRDLEEMIARQREVPRRRYYLAIVPRALGEVVGMVTLEITSLHHHEGNIGVMVQRQHWRAGYAADACRALLDHAFDSLGLHRICAIVMVGNDRSVRLFEQLGFTREGILREHKVIGGRRCDGILFSLLCREYPR